MMFQVSDSFRLRTTDLNERDAPSIGFFQTENQRFIWQPGLHVSVSL